MALALLQVRRHLGALRDEHGLTGVAAAIDCAERLLAALAGADGQAAERRRSDLSGFLDRVQGELAALQDHIAQAFFPGRGPGRG